MYDEAICEGIPLLLSGNASYIKEHNRQELGRCASYYELRGDKEIAKQYREAMNRFY